MAQPVHFNATVSEVIAHSPDVHSYTLISERRLPKFLPGQFIHLSLEMYDPSTFWPESRVFSVANSVSDGQTIRLTIGRQGKFTSRILDEVKPGDGLSCKGPYGNFVFDTNRTDQKVVLVAGGTGITPFSAFMDHLLTLDNPPFDHCRLYYGARSEELLLYRTLAGDCAEKFTGFTFRLFSESGSHSQSISSGRLDIDEIVKETEPVHSTIYYLSGPKPMIDCFSTALRDIHRLSNERIKIDAW